MFAIWWIRRDLRLSDNPALHAALSDSNGGLRLIPLFVIDPALWESRYASPMRINFLLEGLRTLNADLQARGSRLIVRAGNPADELLALSAEIGKLRVYAEEDYTPYARRRDEQVRAVLGNALHLTRGLTVFHPNQVLKADGTPYTVFTPFSKAWLSQPQPNVRDVLLPPATLTSVPPEIVSLAIPEPMPAPPNTWFVAGERAAQERLQTFVDVVWFKGKAVAPVFEYNRLRDVPGVDGTSGLSPYLRFGMLSARQAVVSARVAIEAAPDKEARQGAERWLSELIWREFYHSILYHFPQVRTTSFRPQYDQIRWQNNPEDFAAWCEGRTGYPIVDAAMRQLRQTGWMHNRTRMITASFLVKDLLIDWRWGEQWFMQNLLDGDPANNNGGWQWSAGCGTDAAPYFRIFNPVLQSKKFDPEGAYIRQYLPELARVPNAYIHEPHTMPLALQKQVGCIIGVDYPAPIVDHHFARARTLSAYAVVSDK